jgi:3-oxoacyl-[acyl-carrier-protein] synthase III
VRNAYISGTGGFVPPNIVTNQDMVDTYGVETSHEWIVQRTGIEERRFSAPGNSTSDLALPAAQKALAAAGLKPNDLDLILFSTLSPDMVFPGSGVYLQEKLGLCGGEAAKFVPAMDIRNQCSGFVYGIATATSMIQSGAAKHVLVVGAETHSGAVDLSTRGRNVCTLFGDGAGAVVMSATDADRGVRGFVLGADGRFGDKLCQKVWDMSARPYIPCNEEGMGQVSPEMMYPYMEGRLVFKHAVSRMIEALHQVCAQCKVGIEEIDLFCFHQANMRINQMVAQRLNIGEDKLIHNIHKFGNTTAATIPLLLAEAELDERLRPGMKVAMVAFGSGFTWGAAIADW